MQSDTIKSIFEDAGTRTRDLSRTRTLYHGPDLAGVPAYIYNSYSVGMDSWVQTAVKLISWETLFWSLPLPRKSYKNHFSFLDNYRISPTILIKIYKISGDAGTIMWYSSWCRVVPSRFSGAKKWMKFEIADVPSLTRPVRAPRLF